MKIEYSRQIFENYSNIKIHASPFSGSPVVAFGQTDGQTDTKKLVVYYVFFWVVPRRLNYSDAGELPKRKHNIFRTRRKFEIMKASSSFSQSCEPT